LLKVYEIHADLHEFLLEVTSKITVKNLVYLTITILFRVTIGLYQVKWIHRACYRQFSVQYYTNFVTLK